MSSIRLQNINKRFGAFHAVKDFSLDVPEGEFLVLLGPSGCGKTTTMRMVAGLEEISEGDLLFDDQRVNELLPKDRDIAMVFQNYGLYPHMTIKENISYPLRLRGTPVAERDERVARAAKRVELTELMDRRPKALSGGQRQRVALARALVREPRVFLMDEPLSNLDAKLRVTMRAELKHLHHELGVTTIYVTHDQIEAMTLADRVVVMSHGEIIQVGTPEQIYNEPANLFVAGFIGSPAMNLIHGAIEDGTFVAPGVRVPGVATGSRDRVVLGARCEDLDLCEPDDGAHLSGPLFSLELLGETTQATVRLPNRDSVVIKGSKDYREAIDTPIGVRFDVGKTYFFDGTSEQRISL
ncbi:MAG: ABC transporter ATP-binding protein [Inquilinus sp.]|nr:ABC transporter ATP-binding protein [Inquilinus sp.]